ncbi:hypothetical protein J3R83DRAFT_3895 [Lanmaoa asiatica]|nr:hypothetical protein J3R83DRAFT_3895 [Lanmaoa asiatica]
MFTDASLLENLPFQMEAPYHIIYGVKVLFIDDRLSYEVTEFEEGSDGTDHRFWDQAGDSRQINLL